VDKWRDRLVRKGNYVYGSFLKPSQVDGYINGINPGDRSDSLGRYPFSESGVDDAVTCAAEGAAAWRRVGLNERAQAVRRFRDALHRELERAAGLVTRENGKPFWEARQEILNTIHALDLFLDDGMSLLAPTVLERAGARTDRVPRGVVAMVCPYNLPIQVCSVRIAAAVLAGDAVVFKPSKFTPATGQFVTELWDRCRLPRGVINMVQGSGSVVGKTLIAHPGVDALLVAGSFNTAMTIRRSTFDRPELPVHYETGGKGIALVLSDADPDRAAREVLIGAFLTAGQRHNSTGRVIVQKAIYGRFVETLVSQAAALAVGYGFDQGAFMGPVISENFRSRFRKYSRALARKGHAALLMGGSHPEPPRRGFYVTPSIFELNWRGGSPFLNEEPPGPTLLVYPVDTDDEAIELHNRAVYRLVASVFTRREGAAISRFCEPLRTGAVNVNRATIYAALRLHSVGLGRSSGGQPGGLDLLRALTYPRAQIIAPLPEVTDDSGDWRDEDTRDVDLPDATPAEPVLPGGSR